MVGRVCFHVHNSLQTNGNTHKNNMEYFFYNVTACPIQSEVPNSPKHSHPFHPQTYNFPFPSPTNSTAADESANFPVSLTLV